MKNVFIALDENSVVFIVSLATKAPSEALKRDFEAAKAYRGE